MKNDNAFPMMPSHTSPEAADLHCRGLTKRELFAAMVLGHIIQRDGAQYGSIRFAPEKAECAVAHADALLAELAKDEP